MGCILTIIVQSSSVFTSTLTPLGNYLSNNKHIFEKIYDFVILSGNGHCYSGKSFPTYTRV